MDIYGAGNNIKKLLTYVENLADSRPKLYNKSKDRLKEIATTCNTVVQIISEILEEEVLQEDSIEFGQTSELTSVIDDMQHQIDRIKQFTQNSTPTLITDDSADSATAKVISSNNISSAARKKAMKNYTSCLSQLSNISTDYPFADRCAKLLWSWFDTRFLKTVQGTNFRYNMKRFPDWIQAIVILYGKAIHEDSVSAFEIQFQAWLHQIVTTDAKNKYAVPYEIFKFCNQPDPLDVTLDGVVLWDILLDNGLRDLCTSDRSDLYLDEYGVYNKCNEVSPDILDSYCNYATHSELFTLMNWEVAHHE